MTTLMAIELTCPVCDMRFQSHRIASTNSMGQDTDFRPHVAGADPQPHYVHVCPHCKFAAFELDYELMPDTVREFMHSGQYRPEEVILRSDAAEMSGSTKYLLAVLCYAHDSRASELRLAALYLRASWCARQEGLPDREREVQCQAALLFEKALAGEEIAEDQLKTIQYLLGELYRRIGRHELALAMFDAALAAAADAEDADEEARERLDALIRRQRQAALSHDCRNMLIEDD